MKGGREEGVVCGLEITRVETTLPCHELQRERAVVGGGDGGEEGGDGDGGDDGRVAMVEVGKKVKMNCVCSHLTLRSVRACRRSA